MSAAGMGTAGWLVEALVASTLLMALVLVARAPVRRLFGPQLGYALWALPVLRLALPPLPAAWREQATMPIAYAGEAVTVMIVPVTGTAPAATVPAATLPWGALLAIGWGLGAIGFFAIHLSRHRRFCARLLGEARLLDRIDGVRVIETPAATGPLAFGIARRFVAFPRDFADRYDAGERELALAHELGHHARGDLVANWVALGVLALHWFNPIAWRAFRAFRCDQELANDARVLAGRSRVDRHAYACAILKAAHGGAVSAACHLHTIADLKGRLTMLTNARISRARFAAGAAAVLGLVTTGLAVTASGTRAAAAVTDRIEAATGTTPSTPPVPPVPLPPVAGKNDRQVRRVVIVKNGRTQMFEGAEADRYVAANRLPLPPAPPAPPAPAGSLAVAAAPAAPAAPMVPVNITSADCGPGPAKAYVVTRQGKNGAQTLICTDRIQAAAMAGQMTEADQTDIQRKAMGAALASLRTSRAAMAANRDMTGDHRSEAIAAMDSAIKELEGEIADIGKD